MATTFRFFFQQIEKMRETDNTEREGGEREGERERERKSNEV